MEAWGFLLWSCHAGSLKASVVYWQSARLKKEKYGVESSKWTHWELAMVANRDGITTSISPSTVGRILAEANIKPHRSKYWEFPNIEDKVAFSEKTVEICELYHNSEKELQNHTHTVSVDEKTGMQALSRINPDKEALPGKVAKLEFEYKRHGTQALIPSFEVGTGKIDWIIVAHASKDGRIGLAVGPIFSYYEFPWPMRDRLTDEKWRNQVIDQVDRPDWIASFIS